MGLAVFEWGKRQLTLLYNRHNFDVWNIDGAAWNGDVLSGEVKQNGGTWCGVSKNGRVAFLVDKLLNNSILDWVALLPAEFLKGNMSPNEFANGLVAADPTRYKGMAFELIVADVASDSMICICKESPDDPKVRAFPVGPGMHTLSANGYDSEYAHDARLKEYKDKEKPSLMEVAGKFMYDSSQAVKGDDLSAFFVDFETKRGRYRTTSTTALTVKTSITVDQKKMN